jgi:DNA-directed RNA polymerase specialized sigma24 family protein
VAYSINVDRLEKIMYAVRANPKDQNAQVDLLTILQPIIGLTKDRFPQHLGDDVEQEIRLFVIRKAEYLSGAFFRGRIKNPTNYFFRVCFNAAMNYLKKENRGFDHMVPIEDLKLQPVYEQRLVSKQKILEKIREEVLEFIRVRFEKRADQAIAERFVNGLLKGQRPSFHNKILHKEAHAQYRPAKDIYSIVLDKLRDLTRAHIEELRG